MQNEKTGGTHSEGKYRAIDSSICGFNKASVRRECKNIKINKTAFLGENNGGGLQTELPNHLEMFGKGNSQPKYSHVTAGVRATSWKRQFWMMLQLA